MYNTTKLKVLLVQVVLKPTRPSTEKGNDDQAWIWDHQQTFWHHKSTWWWAFQRWQSKRWISAIHIFQWDQRQIVRRRRHKEYWANNRCNKGWGRLGFCSDHEWRLQGRKGQSIWFVFVYAQFLVKKVNKKSRTVEKKSCENLAEFSQFQNPVNSKANGIWHKIRENLELWKTIVKRTKMGEDLFSTDKT